MSGGNYRKTPAGREAIRSRGASLSRAARNLLLVIDATKSGDAWLALVANATAADLAHLDQAGYIAEVTIPWPAAPPTPAPAAPLDEALQRLGYRELYELLTAAARKRLGLIKGYRTVLEIEKCAGADEIRKLAARFIDDVRAAQGDAAAREVARGFGADLP